MDKELIVIIAIVVLLIATAGVGIHSCVQEQRENDEAWGAVVRSGCKPTRSIVDDGAVVVVECRQADGVLVRKPGAKYQEHQDDTVIIPMPIYTGQ